MRGKMQTYNTKNDPTVANGNLNNGTNCNLISSIENGGLNVKNNLVKERINLFSSVTSPHRNMDASKGGVENLTHCDDCNKIIVYTTSLGFVRKTKSDCLRVKKILRCLMFRTEERNIVDKHVRKEYDKRFKGLPPPQILISNQHIGGADELELLVESGEIFDITKNIDKVCYFEEPCTNCAGHGYTNCPKCLGSGRSKVIRIGSSRELSSLKCTFCKEGLVKCPDCLDVIH